MLERETQPCTAFQALHGKVGELGPSFERRDKTFSQQVLTLLLKTLMKVYHLKHICRLYFNHLLKILIFGGVIQLQKVLSLLVLKS